MVRKSFFVSILLVLLAGLAPAQTPAPELERIRALVEAGALPKSALQKAEAALQDKVDDAILRRMLYGSLKLEDTTQADVDEMLAAAERRVKRVEERMEQVKPLVAEGIYAKSDLEPLQMDLDARRHTLQLAQSRAEFLKQLAEMARAEEQLQDDSGMQVRPAYERFNGRGAVTDSQMRVVALAFARQFGRSLPVSASGETAFHRAIGFDHRGRVDVALTPDSAEGQWLLRYLEQLQIPYFAFRQAMAGSATGAHIHIGPPSLRLRAAD